MIRTPVEVGHARRHRARLPGRGLPQRHPGHPRRVPRPWPTTATSSPTRPPIIVDRVAPSSPGSRGVGVYVDGYVSDVTIRRSEVSGAGASGIYLGDRVQGEPIVEGNLIVDNGYIENGPGRPATFTFGGIDLWFWGIGREGLSIDGSYENTIVGNIFTGNSAGGIFLYKNCGEYPDRDPATSSAATTSDGNLIEGNRFVGGRQRGVGRLPHGREHLAHGVHGPGLRRRARPAGRARPRRGQRGARATPSTTSPTASGSRTTAPRSRPTPSPAHAARPPRRDHRHAPPHRGAGPPVAGDHPAGQRLDHRRQPRPLPWVHGEVGTGGRGQHRPRGSPPGWCEGEPPPRQPFVMVVAVRPGRARRQRPPAPDLTVPTLGALAPCAREAAPGDAGAPGAGTPGTPSPSAPAVPVTTIARFTG